MDGYALTIIIRSKRLNEECSLSSIYLPPKFDKTVDNKIFAVDFYGGDTNQHPVRGKREGVYTFQNLSIYKKTEKMKSFSDHTALICKTSKGYKFTQNNFKEIYIQDKGIIKQNEIILESIASKRIITLPFLKPTRKIKVEITTSSIFHPEDVELWEDIKKQ